MSPSNRSMPSLILITGMSGAGRRATAAALEELGWYVADNLPPELITRMVELSFAETSPIEKLAVVTDVRSRDFAGSLTEVLTRLEETGRHPTVLFLEAKDSELIKRYDAVRRTHPLQDGGTLQQGIDRERLMLAEIKERADIVLDTTDHSVHDLRHRLEEYFLSRDQMLPRVNVQSFGFKHGAPQDMDMLFDVRFISNPYWIPELREFKGTDVPVADFVLDQEGVDDFLKHATNLLSATLPGYRREGKSFVTVAIGCTGGHHRSVAITEALVRRLNDLGVNATAQHRDINH